MVMLLLKNRSPLNATDNEGFTPLHHAVAEGHGMSNLSWHQAGFSNCIFVTKSKANSCSIGDTAVALLKEEADFTLKTSEGELAIDLAPDKEVRLPRLNSSFHSHLPPFIRAFHHICIDQRTKTGPPIHHPGR